MGTVKSFSRVKPITRAVATLHVRTVLPMDAYIAFIPIHSKLYPNITRYIAYITKIACSNIVTRKIRNFTEPKSDQNKDGTIIYKTILRK
jgi:hypothetical protein